MKLEKFTDNPNTIICSIFLPALYKTGILCGTNLLFITSIYLALIFYMLFSLNKKFLAELR